MVEAKSSESSSGSIASHGSQYTEGSHNAHRDHVMLTSDNRQRPVDTSHIFMVLSRDPDMTNGPPDGVVADAAFLFY